MKEPLIYKVCDDTPFLPDGSYIDLDDYNRMVAELKTELFNDDKRNHEEQRKALWISVATGVAQSSNSIKSYDMSNWADVAVTEFDNRFK